MESRANTGDDDKDPVGDEEDEEEVGNEEEESEDASTATLDASDAVPSTTPSHQRQIHHLTLLPLSPSLSG